MVNGSALAAAEINASGEPGLRVEQVVNGHLLHP
jgi:hypothetical protein